MEEDLFSRQPANSLTAGNKETAPRAGEARENARHRHPGNAEDPALRRIDYLRSELRLPQPVCVTEQAEPGDFRRGI